MGKTIPLTRGYEVIVDDEDYEWLSQWKWCASAETSAGVIYAERGQWNPDTKKVTSIAMHRLLLPSPDSNLTTDHIDGNGLNNQKINLRLATKQQQAINRPIRQDNKSGYKGVYWLKTRKTTGKWRAQIKYEGKRLSLGLYDDIEEAAKAYEIAAEKYYGEWRRL